MEFALYASEAEIHNNHLTSVKHITMCHTRDSHIILTRKDNSVLVTAYSREVHQRALRKWQ